jgi:signal transduction histidine kinase
VEMTVTPFAQGQRGFAIFVHDVTLQRENEQRREQLLGQERETVAKLQALDQLKDNVISHVSHELRSPLTSILGYTQILVDEELDPEQQRYVTTIARNANRLQRVIDDLLFLSRADVEKVELPHEAVDLAALVRDAIEAVKPFADSSELTLETAIQNGVVVEGDAGRLGQVIDNLLSNAVKYTPAGGTISLSVDREGEHAVLRVTDTGIGMPGELAARVFEPFVQGERPLDRSYGGLGIGLTLVRRLAELHGGVAFAQSEGSGKGSTFTVRLPAVNAPVSRVTGEQAAKAVQPRDVFIVEDNADARETLKRLLEFAGHRVRVALDGPSALQAMRESAPEIALIDIGLPKMDGYELARRIRAEIDAAQRPVLVAVTGYGLPEDRSRSAAAGFDVHLVKPVDLAALNALLSGR